jgi:hypothetical protein
MITMDAYWKGRDVQYANELTYEIFTNAADTVERVNKLLDRAGRSHLYQVNSGWRPQGVNDATRNAASRSSHLTAEAVDITDPDGDLDKWCLANLGVLKELGLWLEHPGWTDGWCHLQTRGPGWPPKEGPRVFIPSSNPPQTTIYGMSAIWDEGVA